MRYHRILYRSYRQEYIHITWLSIYLSECDLHQDGQYGEKGALTFTPEGVGVETCGNIGTLVDRELRPQSLLVLQRPLQ